VCPLIPPQSRPGSTDEGKKGRHIGLSYCKKKEMIITKSNPPDLQICHERLEHVAACCCCAGCVYRNRFHTPNVFLIRAVGRFIAGSEVHSTKELCLGTLSCISTEAPSTLLLFHFKTLIFCYVYRHCVGLKTPGSGLSGASGAKRPLTTINNSRDY